jgi:hypothetical protein
MNSAFRPCVTAGAALVGAGVIAVTPVTAPLPDVHVPGIQLTAGETDATDATNIVIDIVRHGQRMPPQDLETTQSPPYPGVPLSDLGQQQAQDVGNQLFNELGGPNGVAGIFSGQSIRDMDTAAPFAMDEEMTPQILPGLDEVDPGVYANDPLSSPGGILYELTVALWPLGLVSLQIPGSEDFNGVVFDEKFTDAVDTMYNDAMANPVVSDNGQITDVAFNNEASVIAWSELNVKNPDYPFFLSHLLEAFKNPSLPLLPNAGIVQIEGNPTDGWTMTSFAGQPIPQNPGLLSDLLADVRNLLIAQQTAEYNIFEAALSGDPTTIENALQVGFNQVDTAQAQFPESVFNDIVYAIQNPGSAFNDIIDAIQYLSTGTAGQAAGETGTMLSDAFAPMI